MKYIMCIHNSIAVNYICRLEVIQVFILDCNHFGSTKNQSFGITSASPNLSGPNLVHLLWYTIKGRQR